MGRLQAQIDQASLCDLLYSAPTHVLALFLSWLPSGLDLGFPEVTLQTLITGAGSPLLGLFGTERPQIHTHPQGSGTGCTGPAHKSMDHRWPEI